MTISKSRGPGSVHSTAYLYLFIKVKSLPVNLYCFTFALTITSTYLAKARLAAICFILKGVV